MNKLYRFVYEDQVLFESEDELKVDDYVDKWLYENFDALDDYNVTEENVDEQMTWFKAKHIEEVS